MSDQDESQRYKDEKRRFIADFIAKMPATSDYKGPRAILALKAWNELQAKKRERGEPNRGDQ